MAVFSVKDPRLDSSHCLAKKVVTEVQLKRVCWDHSNLTTSFKQKKKNTTKKPKTVQVQHKAKAYATIASPPCSTKPYAGLLHETLRRNSVESVASTCSNDSGKWSTENAQCESSSNNYKHDLPPSSPEPTKRLKSTRRRKKMCFLEKEPTLLENYLMRIHELVRIAVDETYVENQCKKLLSNMVKTVSSFESKKRFLERRL